MYLISVPFDPKNCPQPKWDLLKSPQNLKTVPSFNGHNVFKTILSSRNPRICPPSKFPLLRSPNNLKSGLLLGRYLFVKDPIQSTAPSALSRWYGPEIPRKAWRSWQATPIWLGPPIYGDLKSFFFWSDRFWDVWNGWMASCESQWIRVNVGQCWDNFRTNKDHLGMLKIPTIYGKSLQLGSCHGV